MHLYIIVLLITILLSWVFEIVNNRSDKIKDEVRIRTLELNQAKEETTTIIESTVDPLITIDDQGTIDTFNPAAERTFGYSASEVATAEIQSGQRRKPTELICYRTEGSGTNRVFDWRQQHFGHINRSRDEGQHGRQDRYCKRNSCNQFPLTE